MVQTESAEQDDADALPLPDTGLPELDKPEPRMRGRKPLPADLPRERIAYDFLEDQKICPCCSMRLQFFLKSYPPFGQQAKRADQTAQAERAATAIPVIRKGAPMRNEARTVTLRCRRCGWIDPGLRRRGCARWPSPYTGRCRPRW